MGSAYFVCAGSSIYCKHIFSVSFHSNFVTLGLPGRAHCDMGIFRSPRDAMCGDSDPPRVFITHGLELTEYFQELLATTRVVIRNVDSIFSVIR